MIITARNGSLFMVDQNEHGRLAGELCEHWGNDAFAVPHPERWTRIAASMARLMAASNFERSGQRRTRRSRRRKAQPGSSPAATSGVKWCRVRSRDWRTLAVASSSTG